MKLIYTTILSSVLLSVLPPGNIFSQTHLKIVLTTSLPIDTALIVHYTNKESFRAPFKDTLEMDFNAGSMDFYHINYTQKEKIYNAQVFLDSGNIEVFTSIVNDKLVVDKVMGSSLYNKVDKWKKEYAILTKAKDTVAIDSFLLQTYEEQIDNIFSFNIGSRYLNLHQNEKLKLYALLPLMAKQDAELKKKFGYSMLNERVQGIISTNIITLSNFELVDIKNNITHAGSMYASFVILDFWFVGCIPCMQDHKRIKELLPSLKQKKVELISISNDESYEQWKNYLKKNTYSWQQYKKPLESKNIVSQLGITTYPTYILLNKSGEIIHSTYYLDEILKQIK